MRWHLPPRHRSASSPSSSPCSARTRSRLWWTSSRARSCSATTSAASADVSKLTSPHRRRQAFDPTFAAMHLTPAMVDDLMAIEPLAAHDLLNGLKQELPDLPVGRRHVPGVQRTVNWSAGRHAERHVSPRGSSTVPWLWTRGSWIRRPLAKCTSFSKVRPFRSCALGRPTFEEFRPKVGPTQIR